MEFGLFDHLDLGQAPVEQLYEDRLSLAAQAESLGFGRYHVAEHHGTPLGMAPSPNVFLAALSQRTTRIRFGPLVYIVPLYDSYRLAEEIWLLDQLSRGRLEVGVGRGASPYELGFFGLDVESAFPQYAESVQAVTHALASGRMKHSGTHIKDYDAPLVAMTQQQPYPPLWYASNNPDSARWAGAQGMHFIGGGPGERFRPVVDSYWQAWQEHRSDESRLNAHVEAPRVGFGRQIVVAPSDEEAVTLAREAHDTHRRHFLQLWHENSDHGRDWLVDTEKNLESGVLLAGSPSTVLEGARAAVEASGVNYLMCTFAFGSLSHSHAVRSLRLFATEVMPYMADL